MLEGLGRGVCLFTGILVAGVASVAFLPSDARPIRWCSSDHRPIPWRSLRRKAFETSNFVGVNVVPNHDTRSFSAPTTLRVGRKPRVHKVPNAYPFAFIESLHFGSLIVTYVEKCTECVTARYHTV
jgi:hypothetical protein